MSEFETLSMSEDPLLNFRNSLRAKQPPTLLQNSKETKKLTDATHVKLSSTLTIPKSTSTRIRKAGSTSNDPISTPEDFVSLGAVYLAWKLKDALASEYLKQVRENGYTTASVGITERKTVADWLEGKQKDLPNAAPLLQGLIRSLILDRLFLISEQWTRQLHLVRRLPLLRYYPKHLHHQPNGNMSLTQTTSSK